MLRHSSSAFWSCSCRSLICFSIHDSCRLNFSSTKAWRMEGIDLVISSPSSRWGVCGGGFWRLRRIGGRCDQVGVNLHWQGVWEMAYQWVQSDKKSSSWNVPWTQNVLWEHAVIVARVSLDLDSKCDYSFPCWLFLSPSFSCQYFVSYLSQVLLSALLSSPICNEESSQARHQREKARWVKEKPRVGIPAMTLTSFVKSAPWPRTRAWAEGKQQWILVGPSWYLQLGLFDSGTVGSQGFFSMGDGEL